MPGLFTSVLVLSSSFSFVKCTKLDLMAAVSKDVDPETDSVLTRMLQAVAVPLLGNVCHVFMHGLNQVQVSFTPICF